MFRSDFMNLCARVKIYNVWSPFWNGPNSHRLPDGLYSLTLASGLKFISLAQTSFGGTLPLSLLSAFSSLTMLDVSGSFVQVGLPGNPVSPFLGIYLPVSIVLLISPVYIAHIHSAPGRGPFFGGPFFGRTSLQLLHEGTGQGSAPHFH